MIRSTVLALALAAGALACASSPQQAPAPTPQPSRAPAPVAAPAPAPAPSPAPAGSAAGVYDYVASAMGEQVPGTLNITFRDGVYGGVMTSSMLPDTPLSSVAVDGPKIIVSADSPNGTVVMEFTMTGKELAGSWSVGGEGGPIAGRKRDG